MPWNGGDPGGASGPRLPEYMDRRNEFGRLFVLQMTGKEICDGKSLPLPQDHILIGTTIENAVGHIESAATEEQGARYILRVRNPNQVEKLLSLTSLMDGTKISIRYHPVLNRCKCVISTYDLINYEESVLKENLQSQGVNDVKRITRKAEGKIINTPAIILTFGTTTYPTHVKVGLLRFPTRPFYPNPTLCFGCYQYGHVGRRCSGPKRCYNCSEEHDVEEGMGCGKPAFCFNCKGDHRPSNRKCPVYRKESEVIQLKVNHSLSYADARKRLEQGSGSYAKVTAQSRIDNSKLDSLLESKKKKDEEIAKLVECVQQKTHEIDQLAAKLSKMESFVAMFSEQHKNTQITQQETQLPSEGNVRVVQNVQRESLANTSKTNKRNGNKKISETSPQQCKENYNEMSPPPKRTTATTSQDATDDEINSIITQEEMLEISDSEFVESNQLFFRCIHKSKSNHTS